MNYDEKRMMRLLKIMSAGKEHVCENIIIPHVNMSPKLVKETMNLLFEKGKIKIENAPGGRRLISLK